MLVLRQFASEYSKLIIIEKIRKISISDFSRASTVIFSRQVTSIPVLTTLVVVVEGAAVADSVVHVDHVGVLAAGLDNGWREKRSTSPRTDGLLHPGSALVTILHTLVQERQSNLQVLDLTLQVCRF